MNNCTLHDFILGNDYLNIYGIDINNHKDSYFTIGENKRQKFALPLEKVEITVIKQVKNGNKAKFVSNQFIEAPISPKLTLEMKEELIEILFQCREAFASDDEPLAAIKGHEVEIILNLERPYPPLLRIPAYPASHRGREALEGHINELIKLGVLRKVEQNEEVEVTSPVIITWHNDKSGIVSLPYPLLFRRPAYPASPRAQEALESHFNDLMKLGVLRKLGHNEELEVTSPVIITWNNDKSRMVGDFRALDTYTIPDRYPIPRIHETLTQLSKARLITSMDALKGSQQNVLTPHAMKY
ncbi:hypothetical protein O181_109256 [Austropuccinia psidii MF-1]|uniref:Uncharacterized protein n=1 Tax=Austropuccinia psidii MF-1 TaxID=1389203 RepID=A0A9Q3PQR1_9BASI|nr:hypothetical protein [Austropuccinia psidii MF-1]